MEEKPYMELRTTHIQVLNSKLPSGFTLQVVENEAETLKQDLHFVPRIPEKRATRTKRPVLYEGEEGRQTNTDASRKLMNILRKLQSHPMSGPFLSPVNVTEVPDYREIVQEPMDLSGVEEKLRNGEYSSAYEFSADVRKIWSNSFLYNGQSGELFGITAELSSYFEGLFRGNENMLLIDRGDALESLYKELDVLKKEIRDIKGGKSQSKPSIDKPMTLIEKKALGQSIRSLRPEHLGGLITLVKDSLPHSMNGPELEFDIDTLPPKVLRDLERYVKRCTSAPDTKSVSKKKSTGTARAMPEPVLPYSKPAVAHSGSESESSSSSDSEEPVPAEAEVEGGMEADLFPSGDYAIGPLWTNFQQRLPGSEPGDIGHIMDFDRA